MLRSKPPFQLIQARHISDLSASKEAVQIRSRRIRKAERDERRDLTAVLTPIRTSVKYLSSPTFLIPIPSTAIKVVLLVQPTFVPPIGSPVVLIISRAKHMRNPRRLPMSHIPSSFSSRSTIFNMGSVAKTIPHTSLLSAELLTFKRL